MIDNIKQNMTCSGQDCFDKNAPFGDSLGPNAQILHLNYRGISVEQNPNIIYTFYNLIKKIQPSSIIEIGTFHGGLTLIIKDILLDLQLYNTQIYTYDIQHPEYTKINLANNNIYFYSKNLFSSDYLDFYDNQSKLEIINLIKYPGTTLLLCDGGCKKCEFNILSRYLKSNDIIMAHDYAPNAEYFEKHMKGKIWNWMEIQDSDIELSCQEYSLKAFMRDEFLEVAWACFKKS